MISLLFLTPPISAENERFESDLDKVTVFNEITDYFYTFGRSKDDKRRILQQRKIARRKIRLRRKREKKQKEYQKLIQGKKKTTWPWEDWLKNDQN